MIDISHKFELLEPSLADAILLIENDPSLEPAKRTQWLCSIRRIAKCIDRPLDMLPSRITALRHPVGRLNAARLGISQKTLANHKSNLKAALNHLSNHGVTLARGTPLSPEWCALMQRIEDPWARKRIHALFRYLSARGLQPDNVNDGVLGEFFGYRTQATFLDMNPAYQREIARSWNACVDRVPGFPQHRFSVEPVKPRNGGPDWEAFPQSFRDEVEAYLETLNAPHRSISGRRWRGCKPSTIKTRRREIIAAARQLVLLGEPVANFTSLRDLLAPEMMRKLLDAYWEQNGERPTTYVIDLSWKFLSIARHTNCLTVEELDELDDMRYALEQHRQLGLTNKNMAVVRAVVSGKIWGKVIDLPDRLMADARKLKAKSPVKAAVLAQIAVAIKILTYAPVRVGNLANISLETNLIRPDGFDGPYWLVFPGHDVKNQVDLTFTFDAKITNFIELYIRDFRPVLLRESNQPWLFPGGKGDGQAKCASTLSDQITKRINKELGFRITAHQFRHAAAAIILKNQPGNYELVRRILGHQNVQTTINFYVGLETMESSKQFGELIMEHTNKPSDKK